MLEKQQHSANSEKVEEEEKTLNPTEEMNNRNDHPSELNTEQDALLIPIKIITFGVLHGKIPKHNYDLLYNLQELPNPLTAQARKKMTGLCKELREDFISNSMVKSHFETSYREIVSKFNEKLKELQNIKVEEKQENDERIETTEDSEEDEESEEDDEQESEEESEEEESEDDEQDDEKTFVIAVCCHKGKHRSVSFAEILKERLSSDSSLCSSIASINVLHRDIHKKGASNKNSRGSHKSKFFNDHY